MTTAVDSSVLLDVFRTDPDFGPDSREALRRAFDGGSVLASVPVWAETRAHFPDAARHRFQMDDLQIDFSPLLEPAANRAGELWQEYRRRGGPGRRLLADFLIGAHALEQADALLTRDRGFYRVYFRSLRLLEP